MQKRVYFMVQYIITWFTSSDRTVSALPCGWQHCPGGAIRFSPSWQCTWHSVICFGQCNVRRWNACLILADTLGDIAFALALFPLLYEWHVPEKGHPFSLNPRWRPLGQSQSQGNMKHEQEINLGGYKPPRFWGSILPHSNWTKAQ